MLLPCRGKSELLWVSNVLAMAYGVVCLVVGFYLLIVGKDKMAQQVEDYSMQSDGMAMTLAEKTE